MRIELVGTDCPVLPGVTVGLQRGTALVDERPAEGGTLTWSLDARVAADGDLAGPFVHGRRGARFVYLVWSRPPEGMFRRAKLLLADLPASATTEDGAALRGRLGLTMADGSPVCAAVRAPALVWSAA
jgi:hypothetical protein